MKTNLYLVILLTLISNILLSQISLGTIIESTRPGLPKSYNFQEYVYAEPDDEGMCTGSTNASSKLERVFFSQTHRLYPEHPFFFLIAERPAFFQLAITGDGVSPDVQVEGIVDGQSMGTLCLDGPGMLPAAIDLSLPSKEDHFSVTLPKAWMTNRLQLKISVGGTEIRTLNQDELKVGIPTELNLLVHDLDYMDYNFQPHRTPRFERFIEEVASSIPASVIRVGQFPVTIPFPEIAVGDGSTDIIRMFASGAVNALDVPYGNLNAHATSHMFNRHISTGDFLSTTYFGNTLNLDPGGWGGGNSFVSFDFTDVFIHELGHALSLPHWGDFYQINVENQFQFNYPYGGDSGNGGGRGESWNFIQDTYEWVDPSCLTNENNLGNERSDAMQRNLPCVEGREEGSGVWDGFGDFSALAMHRYLIGAEAESGEIENRGESKDFQFKVQQGFPEMISDGVTRSYVRRPEQPQEFKHGPEFAFVPGEEKLNEDVYLIYGSAHESNSVGNLVYAPVAYNGTLPPLLDPTDPQDIESMKNDRIFLDLIGSPRDITIKVTYEDGSVLHALNPYHSYGRNITNDVGAFRFDLCHWSLVVPADKEIVKIEQFRRPFVVRASNDNTEGNIRDLNQNITAANFMDGAEFQAMWEKGQAKKLFPFSNFGNRIWNDLNRNGLDDYDEPGIPGVKVLLWGDSNGDGLPDSQAFGGATTTDEDGKYFFTGLEPGNYVAFAWFLENYDPGGPLENLIPTPIFSDPNNDINGDNNGRPGNVEFPGLGTMDIATGIVSLSPGEEPLDDDDLTSDWVDFDASGNMTVDIGFINPEGCPTVNATISGEALLCPGESTTLKVTDIVAVGDYSLTWEADGSAADSLVVSEPGEYVLNVMDGNQCTGTASFLVSEDSGESCTTSTDDTETIAVEVYPNPVVDQVTIDNGTGSILKASISDATGKEVIVRSGIRAKETIITSKLHPGVYILSVASSDNKYKDTYKIVKL